MTTIKLRDAVNKMMLAIDPETIEETSLINRDGEMYYRAKLIDPVMVRCSTMPEEQAIEMDEVHFLENLLDSDWQMIDEKDKSKGVFLTNEKGKHFVADFSTTHGVALYQEGYISQWIREQRKTKSDERKDGHKNIIQKLRERKLVK